MKIYYFRYNDPDNKPKIEAFSSKTVAQRRISDLKKETKTLRDRWHSYVSNKRGERPPNYVRELPAEIKTVEFDRSSQGMLEAFTYLSNKE